MKVKQDRNNNEILTFFFTGILFIVFISLFYTKFIYPKFINNQSKELKWTIEIPNVTAIPTVSPTINVKHIVTPRVTVIPTQTTGVLVSDNNEPWGIARQVDEHTWTMKVGEDQSMATPEEILSAVNEYRKRNNVQILTMDEKLKTYAQSRADYLYSIKNVDGHKGFNNFLDNEDGFNKLGFTWVGENISYGYRLNGVHLIEWVYAGDEPHDKNQLDGKWSHVGIGVKGTATCLIFATGKM